MATVRLTWILASVAALFGMQAPLCALACSGDATAVAAAPEAEAPPPCHEMPPEPGAAEGSAEPESLPCSEMGCDCGLAPGALAPAPEAVPGATAADFDRAPGLEVAAAPAGAAARVPRPPRNASLPPPDILLLKSTWLV